MSPASQEPSQPLTATELDAWIHDANLKRWQLLLKATDPSRSAQTQAFAEMAALCQNAIEEVRAISAQLREESQAARIRSAEIITESARLLAQHTPLTESQLLQIFKGDQKQHKPCE